VRLHWTLLLFLPYLAMKLAGALGVASVLWGWVAACSLFASVLLHELGHSVIARGRGYPVRDIVLTPIGGVAFLTKAPRRANDETGHRHRGSGGQPPAGRGLLAGSPSAAAGRPDRFGRNTLDLIGSINMTLVIFNSDPVLPDGWGPRLPRAALEQGGPPARHGPGGATRQVPGLDLGLLGLFAGNWILVIIAFVVHQAAAAEYRLVQMQEIPPLDPFTRFGPFAAPFSRGPQRVDADDVAVGPPPYER
jgi:hypothetical protein